LYQIISSFENTETSSTISNLFCLYEALHKWRHRHVEFTPHWHLIQPNWTTYLAAPKISHFATSLQWKDDYVLFSSRYFHKFLLVGLN